MYFIVEIYFEEGWHDFVKENGIEVGDILDLLYIGDRLFKILIWRDGIDITREIIEISSDSSDSSDNDDEREVPSQSASTIFLPDTRLAGYLTLKSGSQSLTNVPLKFASLHFSGFGDSKPAEIWVKNNRSWKATLFVKQNSKKKNCPMQHQMRG